MRSEKNFIWELCGGRRGLTAVPRIGGMGGIMQMARSMTRFVLGSAALLVALLPLQVKAWQIAKKGVCLATKENHKSDWQKKVAALHPGWHYSWGASLPDKEAAGVEFVPMIWGGKKGAEAFQKRIAELKLNKPSNAVSLLGFNEPDGKKQANLTVAEAIEAWPELMKTGRRLGSPAAVHADGEWMQEFMKQAKEKNYRIDFVCVHWYGGPNANGFIDRLKKIHQMYGKPIWITEFAVADWNAKSAAQNRHKPETIQRFMKELLPKLDALDFVERYAWFTYDPTHPALGSSALFEVDGSLTELGKIYAAHGVKK